jgi:hypothetical protein
MTTPAPVDRHATLLVRPLDHDLGHRRLLEILHQLLADLHVLVQELAVLVLAGVPAQVHVRLMPSRKPIS